MYAKICDDEIQKPPDDKIRTGHSGVYLCDFIDQCLIRNESDRPSAKHLSLITLTTGLQQHSKSERKQQSTRSHNNKYHTSSCRMDFNAKQYHNFTQQFEKLWKHKKCRVQCVTASSKTSLPWNSIPKNMIKQAKVGTEAWLKIVECKLQQLPQLCCPILWTHAVAAISNELWVFTSLWEWNLEHEKEAVISLWCPFFALLKSSRRIGMDFGMGKCVECDPYYIFTNNIFEQVELFSSGCIRLYRVSSENKATRKKDLLWFQRESQNMHAILSVSREQNIRKRVGNKPRSNSLTTLSQKIKSYVLRRHRLHHHHHHHHLINHQHQHPNPRQYEFSHQVTLIWQAKLWRLVFAHSAPRWVGRCSTNRNTLHTRTRN